MADALRVADYLDHILVSIDRVLRYTEGMDGETFLANELVQDGVIRNIEIIGEASNNIRRSAPEFAAHHAHIPWQVMYAMRNRVAHAYHEVDIEVLWATVVHDLPPLRASVQALRDATP